MVTCLVARLYCEDVPLSSVCPGHNVHSFDEDRFAAFDLVGLMSARGWHDVDLYPSAAGISCGWSAYAELRPVGSAA
ncbi:MAG: hypothetical protein ACHQ50_17415 [Fimbriimonadales bacterium]